MNKVPKALVFDLDGTLAESKQRVEAEMGLLIGELLKHVPVAVMSGAGFPQFEKQFFPALPLGANLERLFIFPDNAAQCFVYRAGVWHAQYDNAFSPQEREHILKALDEALKETGLYEVPVRVWGERIEDRGAEIVFSGLGQQAPPEEKKKWDVNGAKKRALRDAVAKRLPEFSEGANGSTSVDITRKGITKAYGVQRFAELTGIPLTDMLYVGDALQEGGNDSVVIGTGIPTHEVFGPEETAALIKDLLPKLHA
ncbi:MAG: HAD-IIB family hydrolase [Patescibacteria group bacterium]